MTAADVKIFFRTVIKVVAGGPAVGTPGQNRAAGVLAALDKLAEFAAELAGQGGLAPTYLEISSANNLRVRELPVPAPLTIGSEVLDKNATGIRYQLDTHTRTGTRVYGPANQTLAQINTQLAALTDADRAAGAKLYVRTNAFSTVDDSLIALTLTCGMNLVLAPAKLSDFPQQPGSQGLLFNPYFNDPFTGNENTGWEVNGGWNRDGVNNLAVGDNAQYLYQNPSGFVVGAAYRVLVTVVDHPDGRPVSGGLYFKAQNSQNTPVLLASAAGTYTFDFVATVATERVHLVGGSAAGVGGTAFVGGVAHFDIVRI